MRIVIDLDGTICEIRKDGQQYADVRPLPGAIEKIRGLRADGHYIIIQTARHMKTCNGDVDQVIAKIGQTTLNWLKRYDIPYDEIHFGKPYGDVYIDDLGSLFTGWDNIGTENYNEKKITILIPMAGSGSRFAAAGFVDPKPLIPAKGTMLIEWAMKTFDEIAPHGTVQHIFIILQDHVRKFQLDKKLYEVFGDESIVIPLPEVTRGQAETCLAAKQYIDNYAHLFIHNCDTVVTSPVWQMIENEHPHGIIPCFENSDPKYSYAKEDIFGTVEEVAEKKVISTHATAGLYYFKHGKDFVWAAEKMIQSAKTTNNEYYVGNVYNELIAIGKTIRIAPVTRYTVLGTPEELTAFEQTS